MANEDNNSNLELNGVLKLSTGYLFSIQSIEEKSKAPWKKLGEITFGYKLVNYFDDSQTLQLQDASGALTTISLAKANEESWKTTHSDPQDLTIENLRNFHLPKAKDKVRVSVSGRSTSNSGRHVSSNDPLQAALDAQRQMSSSQPATPQSNDGRDIQKVTQPSAVELSDEEVIALTVYEKHHVPVREAPVDVDVFYDITPR